MDDPYDLERFVAAQDEGETYEDAVAELRRGRKTSHWMWFVFPQIAGLGQSSISRRFAISSVQEAQAYFEHPVLGPRLAECTAILMEATGRTARADLWKHRCSEAALVDDAVHAGGAEVPAFRQVLDRYFEGVPDIATDERI